YPLVREALLGATPGNPFCADLFKNTGFYPGPGDTHVAEFLPHFFRSEDDLEAYGLKLFDIERKKRRTAEFLEKLRAAADSPDPVDLEAFGARDGSEEAQMLQILQAIEDDTREVFFVNLPYGGQIANLPEGAVVEGPAVATEDGLKPLVFGEIPEPIASWTERWLEWGELVVDAALSGDRGRALQCLAADPGCPGFSRSQAVLEELLAANGRWMKHFGGEY
ncbi:MAG: hypothetical protein KAX19_03040, partial [Candidatus Brocadiae bacterium]|nr:hypothetical protein [Candidatus Brocadiia bacterium]